jgi:hypothetical protein
MHRPNFWSVPLLSLVLLVGALAIPANAAAEDRVELGEVDWNRDFDRAVETAKSSGQPLFVLFTEVPGCSTVRGYGREVLSNRFVVDAIESQFVPVAVFNNVDGEDRKVLESFGEPTWNNPAVRIIKPDRSMLAPRLYGEYTVEATLETIHTALATSDGDVPRWLELVLAEEQADDRTKTVIFNMYCFWSGEVGLGQLDGVIRTRPGFLDGTEVVEVTYDPEKTSLAELATSAEQTGAASGFFATSDEQLETARQVFGEQARQTDGEFRYAADDDNYQMRDTPYAELTLTDIQTTRINSAIGEGKPVRPLLSPSQRQALGD